MVSILIDNRIEDWPDKHTYPTHSVDDWENQFILVCALEITYVHKLFEL